MPPSWNITFKGFGELKRRWYRRSTFTFEGAMQVSRVTPPVTGGTIRFSTQEGSSMGEITVKDDEANLSATVTFTDAEGHPTTPDTTPVWSVGDDSVLTVHPTEDGLQATFDVGAPGVSSVSVTTTETGSGDPVDLILTGLVTVTAGDTVAGSIEFSTAAVQPIE